MPWTATVDDFPLALAVSADGRLLAVAAADGSLRLIDAVTGALRRRRTDHALGVQTVAIGDGVLASGGQDGTVRLWRLGSGEAIATIRAGTGLVQHLAWSIDGRRLAWVAGRMLRRSNRAGEPLDAVANPESAITAFGHSPDGQWLAVAGTTGIALHPAVEPGKGRIVLPRKLPLLTLAWSDDSRIVACGAGDSSVHFWRIGSGAESRMSGLGTAPFHGAPLAWIGKRLAIAALDAVVLWDFAGPEREGAAPVALEGHRADIGHLAVDRQRRWLASGDREGRVLPWTPGRSSVARADSTADGEISALVWNPRHDLLHVADGSGAIRALRPPASR